MLRERKAYGEPARRHRRAPAHLVEGLAKLAGVVGIVATAISVYLWVIGVFPPYESVALQGAAYLCIVGPLVLGVLSFREKQKQRRVLGVEY